MKKLLCIFVVTAILLTASGALADDNGLTLTIKDAQELAVKNSPQSGIDDLDIKAKESALKKAREDANATGAAYTLETMLDNKIKNQVDPMKAEINLETAKRQKVENEDTLRLDVYKAVHTILLERKQLEIEKQKLGIFQENYNIAEAQYNQGNVTENDLADLSYKVDSKKLDISKIEKDLASADLELKKLLNLPLDGDAIGINDKLVLAAFQEVDLAKVLSEAQAKDFGVYQKAEAVRLEEKTFELTGSVYKVGESEYDSEKYTVENAQLDLEDAQIKFQVDVKNKYNDLLGKKDKVELAASYEKLAQKKLDSMQAKYDKGVVSRDKLLTEKGNYLDAAYQKYTAIRDYNVAKAEFDAML